MIPFDFAYYRPESTEEAVKCYEELAAQGKKAFYYSGGSEIITMSRVGSLKPEALIDLKAIEECRILDFSGNYLVIGAAVSLAQISEAKLFPCLGTTISRIADHTNQCRITIGGNLCGTIIYREASLPLLLADSLLLLAGPEGRRYVPFADLCQNRLLLKPGEMIVQIHIPKDSLDLPYIHVKKTKNEKIDYPLLTVVAVKHENKIRISFSGLCSYPFRAAVIEESLNAGMIPDFAQNLHLLPEPPLSDLRGSAAYRLFVLQNTLELLLKRWQIRSNERSWFNAEN